EPIAVVLFQRGAFLPDDALATARALAAFAFGLPAFVLIKAFVPGYFARQDTVTPVKIAVAAMIINVVLAVLLMQVLAHAGIALATAITAWLNAGALAVLLIRRDHFRFDSVLRARVPKLLLSAAFMAGGLWGGGQVAATALAGSEPVRIGALGALVLLGLVIYFGVAQMTGAMRLAELRQALRRS
ncbi:MAG TPA: lipid II flippase MurJ, partial [Rhodospirillaceae bacterium]|nr:lipid II flippase MurJ [Rhodospirillaceae bacterium]